MPPKRKAASKKSKAAVTTIIDDPVSTDWTKMTVKSLKEACNDKGLDATGTKAALVQRLQDSESKDEPPAKLQRQDSERTKLKKAFAALKEAPKVAHKAKVDASCGMKNCAEVYEDYNCMLNQTNIGNNNNKFYIIQLLKDSKKKNSFYTWNRWGRVGEEGQNSLKQFSDEAKAVSDFKKKFKDKTKNNWDERDNFVACSGKYTMIEVGDEDDDEEEKPSKSLVMTVNGKQVFECTLDNATQELMKLLFDNDMFNNAMKTMEIDVKKMPLGKLSKVQIAKGFDALVALEDAINAGKLRSTLEQLSSQFYTLIPHDFGRQRPPVIDNLEVIRKKKDVLIVLSDIELAQSMQKDKTGGVGERHPFDINYELLHCQLVLLKPTEKEYKIIETYAKSTKCSPGFKIYNIWRADRELEDQRFSIHNDLDNRKLLWHGTNVAVVAAILKSGLRIMPHSGGRVGRGIYFASENGKSAGYVNVAPNGVGIMFLVEVALGNEKHITVDDSSLVAAPKGYHSVVAKGQTEPDPSLDTAIELDGNKVIVPQGKPKNTKFTNSHFSQSEYLVYKESQARIRYLLTVKIW